MHPQTFFSQRQSFWEGMCLSSLVRSRRRCRCHCLQTQPPVRHYTGRALASGGSSRSSPRPGAAGRKGAQLGIVHEARLHVAGVRQGSEDDGRKEGRAHWPPQTMERPAPYTAACRSSAGLGFLARSGLARTRKRVTLRAPRRADEPEFLALVRASKALHRPWVHPPADPSAFRRYLRHNRGKAFEALLAVRREDGAIVGVFNLSQIFHGPLRSAYLGYWVGRPFSGQGYMAEGMDLLLRHAFRTLKLHRVEANVQPENRASRALVRRAGFRKEGFSPRYLKIGGRWRDHERWAITVEDRRG